MRGCCSRAEVGLTCATNAAKGCRRSHVLAGCGSLSWLHCDGDCTRSNALLACCCCHSWYRMLLTCMHVFDERTNVVMGHRVSDALRAEAGGYLNGITSVTNSLANRFRKALQGYAPHVSSCTHWLSARVVFAYSLHSCVPELTYFCMM